MDRGASSWGAAADRGPTMLSFAGPSSSSTTSLAAEIQLQDFSVRRGRPAGAGRRSRAAGGGGGGVPEACAVDGCRSDLSRCREYHRRHKVCEAHSKTPVVVVGGQEQRFCQQCSRFHMLSEFDEGKRSCRKRLDGHNRRRRKPQHDIMNLGSFFPYGQVNQFAMYPQSVSRSRQNSDSMHVVDRQQTFSISFSGTFKAPKQFPLSQDDGNMFNAPGPLNLLAEHNTQTRTSSVCNALPSTLGPECALSLLSSSVHRSSPTAVQEQVTSSLACIAAASQDTTATAAAVAYASGVGHHAFVPDALFEDPSQALPFPWQQ